MLHARGWSSASVSGGDHAEARHSLEPGSPGSSPRAFSSWAAMQTNGFAACRVNTMFVLPNGFQQDMVNMNSQVGHDA